MEGYGCCGGDVQRVRPRRHGDRDDALTRLDRVRVETRAFRTDHHGDHAGAEVVATDVAQVDVGARTEGDGGDAPVVKLGDAARTGRVRGRRHREDVAQADADRPSVEGVGARGIQQDGSGSEGGGVAVQRTQVLVVVDAFCHHRQPGPRRRGVLDRLALVSGGMRSTEASAPRWRSNPTTRRSRASSAIETRDRSIPAVSMRPARRSATFGCRTSDLTSHSSINARWGAPGRPDYR